MKLWLNGKIADAHETRIDPTDRGFLLGDGLFETMLVRRGHVALFEEHMIRLMKGAEVTGIHLPCAPDEIEAACDDLLEANGLADAPRVALRLTLTRGTGPRGLALPPEPKPTVLLTCAVSAAPPEHLSLASVAPRRNPWSPSARL
jgi:branched-chain amino acid aminotransferase